MFLFPKKKIEGAFTFGSFSKRTLPLDTRRARVRLIYLYPLYIFKMFNFVNNYIVTNVGTFAGMITALFLIVIGTPLISFKGGIPRIAGVIINKGKSILTAILLAIVTFFVISPLLVLLFKFLIKSFVDFTIPILITLSGLALWEWDRKMRWDYKWYWRPFLAFGILLIILEVFLY